MLLPTKLKFEEYVKMGLVRSQTDGNLTIYQYTETTQFDRLWNNVTLNARGIVFDSDGELVQRCLPKFFNHDEQDGINVAKLEERTQCMVQEKVDGSLIKVTIDPKHGLVITSKASFNSAQAQMAKEIIQNKSLQSLFQTGYTYHFELIHPDNQIVLNYDGQKDLILLAIIKNDTGKDINIYKSDLANGFKLVDLLDPSILSDINSLNSDKLHEGVVVNYGNYRLKYKTDEYIRLHRIVTEFTEKRVWEALSNKQPIDWQNIPEEFIKWLDDTEKKLLFQYNALFDEINEAILRTQNMTDKELGLSKEKLKHYVFAIRKGTGIEKMIWRAIKPKEQK